MHSDKILGEETMALVPSPPPNLTPSDNDVLALVIVIALVFLAMVAIFLLHILGPLRRWLSHGLLHNIVMGVYALSSTIGRMQSSNWYVNDFTVWAVFLLLLLSGTDSLTACRLNDIDSWKSIYVKQLFKGFMLVLIVLKFGYDMKKQKVDADYLWYPLSAILIVIVIKSYVMIASMRMVSKSYLGRNVKVIAEYMQYIDSKLVTFDPVTMGGYRYMVAGEKHCVNGRGRCTPWYEKPDDYLKGVTTVEQIWQCKGNLLTGDRGKALKDGCLSMALSKMLNRRFAGFKLSHEEELQKTRDLVFKGLLAGGDRPHQRAFRVIEEELVFVHDMYYTRYSYLYQKGRYLALCLPIIMVALCSWLAVESHHARHQDDRYLSNQRNRRSISSGTIAITVILAFLEAYQLYLYIASGWFKVALIRSYISTPFLQRSGCCCLEMIMGLLLRLKAFRPWKGSLGQYCLLQELGRQSRFKNCLHYTTLRLMDKGRKKGRKSSVKLSESVKIAIIDSLQGSKSNRHLTNGVTSLKKNGVHGDLSWACHATTASDGAVARTIVVWHIATTLCEQKLDKQAKKEDAVKTASTLSQYCMHLLAFAPNLLPDHCSMSESILDQAIDEADNLFKKAKNKNIKGKNKKIEGRCEILMQIISTDDDCGGDQTRLVAQGVHLAGHLIDNIQDSTKRWKVLSDFWAEMMLYVSPSDDARAHLEVLAKGGEFITHLWALLTHAGVLNRCPSRPKDVV